MLAGLALPANLAGIQPYALNAGLFALSGGITNWLAVHMLFERVPGLYGSGVIQLRFEEFKQGIRDLIMEQFFNHENVGSFFAATGETGAQLQAQLQQSLENIDLNSAFDSLVEVIMASSFGNMLGMFGGRDALNPLREPFVEKMREFIEQKLAGSGFAEKLEQALGNAMDDAAVRSRLTAIIDQRLDQMTPQMVKIVVQQMIRQHLGWLVVWGCAFGGAIGFVVTAFNQLV